MKTSPRGIEDLVLSEGIRLKAYKDSVGVWTIGVGHAATSGRKPIPKPGMTIDRAEALRILREELVYYETDVNAVLPNVPQHVFDGAVSFHFNTGAIRRASWVKTFETGNMAAARAAFMTWRKPPEIIGRRTREADLIFKGIYRSKAVAAPIATSVVRLDPATPMTPGFKIAPVPPPPDIPAPEPKENIIMDREIVVPVKSAWASKINWANVAGIAASVLALVGVDVTPETMVTIQAGIGALVGVITIVLRTWFTKTITPEVANKVRL